MLTHEGGKRRYQVLLDSTEVARASLIEQAVEAADYEIGRMGATAVETASMYSAWRQQRPPQVLLNDLKIYPLPNPPQTLEEVFRAITFYQQFK